MKLIVRGASHASAIRFRLEGFPEYFPIDEKALAAFMSRRAPGRDALSTTRKEPDAVILSRHAHALEGVIRNTDTRPADYGRERTVPRPGHADFGQWIETGRIPTGGGSNSGRMTAAICAGGGICKQWLETRGVRIEACVDSIGRETATENFDAEIARAKEQRDSIGGTIRCQATGLRAGLGGALFDGLEGKISQAIFAIPGVKGIAFGNGFEASQRRGSENNDAFVIEEGIVRTRTNRHGGILGGRTTGMPLAFTVALKPTPTIAREQDSVDLATMQPARITMGGRHDPCIVKRAVPVVEAATAYVLMNEVLASETATPRICLTLTGHSLAEDERQFGAQRPFTDMIELRVDLLPENERKDVAAFLSRLDVPAIVTFRRKSDGGAFDGDETVRRAFFADFLSACAGEPLATPARYVDFEDDFRDAELTERAKKARVKIIRSRHDFNGKPGDLVEVCRRLRGETDDIPKIAFMPKTLTDVSRALEETRDFDAFAHILCAMGPLGLATRVLAGRTRSMLTYASLGGLERLGHLSPHELVRTYRLRRQTPDYALYGVTGWPLKATRSPELNNAAWSDEDEDRIMIPFPSETPQEAIAFLRATGMKGLAVTIPHKQTIMPLLDQVDETARAIGAVNTVVVREGRLIGCNTDAEGFSDAIRHFVGRDDFTGMTVAVLGAGGAAKAVVHALAALHARVTTFHRETPRTVYDLIVNATPVDPIPDYAFTGREQVYDLVYVPEVTPLMARALAAGCRVENGFSMLAAQAAAQRRLWQ